MKFLAGEFQRERKGNHGFLLPQRLRLGKGAG